MALSNDQKRQTLQTMLDSLEMDLFRQEVEAEASKAELAGVGDDESLKSMVQASADAAQATINRLKARKQTYEDQLNALGGPVEGEQPPLT